jgi:putative transcriptional regulator
VDSRVGKILVAHPLLTSDDPFHKTVIYIYQDSINGTAGVILNIPTTTLMRDLGRVKGIDIHNGREMHQGGPVSSRTVLLLHSSEWHTGNTINLDNGYSVSSDNLMLEKIGMGDEPAYWRIFYGLCAWSEGQLDAEIAGEFPYQAKHSWVVIDRPTDELLFEYDGDEQWEKALEHAGQELMNQYF